MKIVNLKRGFVSILLLVVCFISINICNVLKNRSLTKSQMTEAPLEIDHSNSIVLH